mgnify:CR=1 FL=1
MHVCSANVANKLLALAPILTCGSKLVVCSMEALPDAATAATAATTATLGDDVAWAKVLVGCPAGVLEPHQHRTRQHSRAHHTVAAPEDDNWALGGS